MPMLELSFDKDLTDTWHWTSKLLIRRGGEAIYNQFGKSFWDKKLYFYNAQHFFQRTVFFGGAIGVNGFEPTLGLMANPYPSTQFMVETNPRRGGVNTVLAYGAGRWEYSFNLGFAKNVFKFIPGILYKINPETNIDAHLSMSTNKMMLSTGINYNFDAASRISFHIKGGFRYNRNGYFWLTGMNFGINYHGLNLSLPVMLGSHNPVSNTNSALF